MGPAPSSAGLTDSDILVDSLRGVPDAINFLGTQQALSGVQVSVISCMELVVGCRNNRELANLPDPLSAIEDLSDHDFDFRSRLGPRSIVVPKSWTTDSRCTHRGHSPRSWPTPIHSQPPPFSDDSWSRDHCAD